MRSVGWLNRFMLIVLLILVQPSAHSTIITIFDVAKKIRAIKAEYERAKHWIETKLDNKAKNKLDTELTAAQIDNDNNIAANKIARLSEQQVEIELKKREYDQKPLLSAIGIIANNGYLGKAELDAEKTIEIFSAPFNEKAKLRKTMIENYTKGLVSSVSQETYNRLILRQRKSVLEVPDDQLILYVGDPRVVGIMLPNRPIRQSDYRQNSAVKLARNRIKNQSKATMDNLVMKQLIQLGVQFQKDTGVVSPIIVYDKIANELFDPKALAEIGGTGTNMGKAQALRVWATRLSIQVKLSVERYEQSLSDELILASRLKLKLDKKAH